MRYVTLVATLWLGCSAALAQAPDAAAAREGPWRGGADRSPEHAE